MNKQPLIYFSSPYTDDNRALEEHRYDAITDLMSDIITCGLPITAYSPITYTHHLAPLVDSEFNWIEFDKQFLLRCDAMIVITLGNWERSRGIKEEIKFCIDNNIPFFYCKNNIPDVARIVEEYLIGPDGFNLLKEYTKNDT